MFVIISAVGRHEADDTELCRLHSAGDPPCVGRHMERQRRKTLPQHCVQTRAHHRLAAGPAEYHTQYCTRYVAAVCHIIIIFIVVFTV